MVSRNCRGVFFFSSRRRHTRCGRDWSSDVCSSDLRSRDRERRVTAPPAGRVVGFGPTVEQLIRGCGQEVVELKNWPYDSLTQMVGMDEKQRDALAQMQSAATASSDTLAA